MSAYGRIEKGPTMVTCQLRPRTYRIPNLPNLDASTPDENNRHSALTVFPMQDVKDILSGQNSGRFEGLWNHLSKLFDSIILEGRTYPQRDLLGLNGFKSYFLSHDLFIGILDVLPASRTLTESLDLNEDGISVEETAPLTMIDLISDRPLEQIIAGIYYIKPNYPGRSSHCCNAGFVVDPKHRGRKIGKTLARSYLHYAPLLGYKASVFNLVYKNNLASIAIWDSLGFQRVGLIPKAGRLKRSGHHTKPDEAEEYVDAIVYWKELI